MLLLLLGKSDVAHCQSFFLYERPSSLCEVAKERKLISAMQDGPSRGGCHDCCCCCLSLLLLLSLRLGSPKATSLLLSAKSLSVKAWKITGAPQGSANQPPIKKELLLLFAVIAVVGC